MGAHGGDRGSALPLPRSGARGWLTMLVYQPLFLLGFLFYSPLLLWRWWTDPRKRTRVRERMGFVPPQPGDRPVVWIHGVSVGEVKAAKEFVARLRQQRPDLRVVLSATTPNGHLVATQDHPDLTAVYYPLDLLGFPSRALDRLQPRCVLLMELEIWPNFLQAARKRDIPVAVVNGRISERTFKGYRLLRGLLPQLDLITRYCVQDKAYQKRLLDLGVESSRVVVTGNMKYDSVAAGDHAAAQARLRPWLAPAGERVVVAGSTHHDEESFLLGAVATAARGAPTRLVLVPRHPERAPAIGEAIRAAGRRAVRWSEAGAALPPLAPDDVVVVDVIGPLQGFYAACDVAFVGGSLIPHGGQNMLEPAAQGKATIFGPHTANFRRDVELLLAAEAVVQASDRESFSRLLGELLADPARCAALGARARAVIVDNRGAAARTFDVVAELFGPPPRR